ncbi:tyrosine-protein phosphatase [Paraburkholderia sp.]|uniref:tyrosine-protein phosphatase n=1 Tax=Paraburkholderia sp. TaxID=1926495 RepID=UPI002386CF80|nr:tyrosine-protein phosphatase [Paraburkholderia sp.]MDE1180689.1 tyrosine-protein phosphatase [Paraburkholderia sp.]
MDAPRAVSGSRRAFLKGSASVMLMSGLGSSLLSACGGGVGSDAKPTARLSSVDNFRDIGGAAAGYPTVDGKQVVRGAFYRSNVLTLSQADEATLNALGIAMIYDLRTPAEVSHTQDVMPVGAAYTNINVTGSADAPMSCYLNGDMQGNVIAAMEEQERHYVTDPKQRANFGALLTQLANTPGTQLIHSQAGKDRAGWVAAVLLSIANVPFEVIMQDYLLTNVYSSQSIKAHVAEIEAQRGEAAAQATAPIFGVQDSILQAGFDQVQASFGTMQSYLTDGLGLSQSTIDTLRARLVG